MNKAISLGLGLLLALAAGACSDKKAADSGKAGENKAATTTLTAEEAMKKTDCFACHAVDKKIVGPSYRDIAARYDSSEKTVATLVKKVKEGGTGNWGQMPMTPHPTLTEAEIKSMVEWVLKQK